MIPQTADALASWWLVRLTSWWLVRLASWWLVRLASLDSASRVFERGFSPGARPERLDAERTQADQKKHA